MTPLPEAPEFADEVVTAALVRFADVPRAGRFALITLDNGHDNSRPSTIGPAGLRSLDAALDAAYAEPDVVGVAVTGKPFVFAVGADLGGIARITHRDQAVQISRLAHRVFRRLGEGPVPTFALINGSAMGGGLELALHCTYRTISTAAGPVGLPECLLGIVPAWGGTQLLPPLVGVEGALKIMIRDPLEQRTLRGAAAHELGLADVIFPSADFLERSLEWAGAVVRGDATVHRERISRGPRWGLVVGGARALVDQRLHGAVRAPYRALDLVALARTADRDEGFAAEDEAAGDLVMTDECRAALYASDLVRRRARRPAGAPDPALARPLATVGIVGAGLMASQLALLFLRRLQVPVVMTDVEAGRLDSGLARVQAGISSLAEAGRVTPDTANRMRGLVSGSLSTHALAPADLVVEAVFEDLPTKREVFADVESVVSPSCVLASNTSSLSLTAMAAGLAHPERVVGLHFFNPVDVLPLVEVVRTTVADDASLATSLATVGAVRKTGVVVADAPAFVVNRLLTRFLGVVTAAVDEGTPLEVADGALAPLGLPTTPFKLLGLVGPAVALQVARTMQAAFPDRFAVSPGLARLVAAGRAGVYDRVGGRRVIDPQVREIFAAAPGRRPPTAEEVRERAVAALADEIRRLLDDGVVPGAAEVDLCMLLGAGWPFHLGGITPYLDRTGVAERVTGRRFNPPGVASLPAG